MTTQATLTADMPQSAAAKAPPTSAESGKRLEHFPAAFFAMVMGFAGLTIAWEKAEAVLRADFPFVPWLIGATTLLFAGLALIYAAKILLHPGAVRAELRHPVRLNFMPTIAISLLLLAIVYLHTAPAASQWLWITGAALQLGFTLFVINSWIHHEHFQILHMNPAWFIPAVGNVLVPVAGVPLGYELTSWFFLSIGFLLSPVLLTIVFNRVLFHQPLPERLMPTLFILIAPPAVGFIAYVRLTGGVDGVCAVPVFLGALFHTDADDPGDALSAHPLLSLMVGLFLPARGNEHREHADGRVHRRHRLSVLRLRRADHAVRHRRAAPGTDRPRRAHARHLPA